MKAIIIRLITRNTVFVWIALAVGLLLLVPLMAMQFTTEVRWTGLDFAVMSTLLFTLASGFVLAARRVPARWWPALAILFTLAFLGIWAELAVGVFTRIGH